MDIDAQLPWMHQLMNSFRPRLAKSALLAVILTLASTGAFATTYNFRVAAPGVVLRTNATLAPAWAVTGAFDFPGVQVGASAAVNLPVNVKNTGSGPGIPSVSAFSGANASDFRVVSNGCATPVEAGQTCTVTVDFAPAARGARTAALQVDTAAVPFTGTGLSADPYFSNVSLLLDMDGVDGASSFVDAKGVAITSVGVLNRTSVAKFGASGYFSGSSSSYLTAPNSTAFGFGTGDFTMETWVNTLTDGSLISLRTDGSTTYYSNVLRITGGHLAWSDGVAWSIGTAPVPAGTWTHVAVTRASGTLRLFVNGTLDIAVTKTLDLGSSRMARIGVLEDGVTPFKGYIDDLRVTKGVARYTSSFTPPAAPM